jgi:hypothetical protein
MDDGAGHVDRRQAVFSWTIFVIASQSFEAGRLSRSCAAACLTRLHQRMRQGATAENIGASTPS